MSAETRCLIRHVAQAAQKNVALNKQAAAACDPTLPLEQALSKVSELVAEREAIAPQLALLDALMLQAYYQWVLDFSFDVRVHPFKSFGRSNRRRLPKTYRSELLKLAPDTTSGDFADKLRSFVPSGKEYDFARKALARYVELMDAGSFVSLPAKGTFEKGAEGDTVAALQKRLAAEGYYDGPVDGQLGEPTHQAVVRYQKAHSLAHGGVLGPQTLESLNLDFRWRVKQLKVALGRHRESPIHRRGAPDFYIRVNIPAFELHLFEEGKATHAHKVIVGSNRRVADPLNDGITWHARRTKIFDTVISEVVLNPTWIVPKAIRIDEIEPKALDNPQYYAENNFKKVGDLLVQGPADTNPLGVVKFSLESTDAIYLHDTDRREHFREIVRDLSHGCVRVDQPVELAKLLLHRQGEDLERIDKRLSAGTTLPIPLTPKIPVFVEYNSLGFFPDGEPIFYRDVYFYDMAYWKKRTPITRRFP